MRFLSFDWIVLYSKAMIPFNQLGPVFKAFASLIYPGAFRKELASVIERTGRGGCVLDIGSGTGILSQFACKIRRDLRYTVIDPAPGMLRFAPDFAKKVIGMAETLPFPSRSFDVILTGDAFHHFKDPDGALQEMRRVIKDDGVLMIFEIDPGSCLGAVITRGEKIFREPAHFRRPERLSEMLVRHGFECRVSRYDWRYSITAGPTGAENAFDMKTFRR